MLWLVAALIVLLVVLGAMLWVRIDNMLGDMRSLRGEIAALTKDLEVTHRRVQETRQLTEKLLELQVEPWRAYYLRDGWSEDEIEALSQLHEMERDSHELAPVYKVWSERYPDVAKKLLGRRQQSGTSDRRANDEA